MKVVQFLERAADTILASVEAGSTFFFRLLTRVCQPAIALGLMYWMTTSLMGYPVTIFPWWNLSWAVTQAIAATIYLPILSARAGAQARAKEWGSLILTLLTLAVLGVSAFSFLGLGRFDQFNAPAFAAIRTAALVLILLTEPFPQARQDTRDLTLLIPIVERPLTERGIPASDPDERRMHLLDEQCAHFVIQDTQD